MLASGWPFTVKIPPYCTSMTYGSRVPSAVVAGTLLLLGAIGPGTSAAFAAAQVEAGAQRPEPKRFIVTLRDGAGDPGLVANEHAARLGADVAFVYRHALQGYAANLSEQGLRGVSSDARVVRVELDGAVSASTTQSPAPWGLDRVDQRQLPLNNSYSSTATGAGVTAYIIDTGLRFSHADFGARATSLYDAVDGGAADDCNGHGTHVAGTVGGATYGMAKDVSLMAVRVLDCAGNGSWSGVIAGIDRVTLHHVAGAPAVANMSLGGGASLAVDTAVKNSIADGVSYAIAAGNGNAGGVAQDACKSSPARVPEAMTVGATDSSDRKASWSNHGNCVDWFAPGVNITSAWSTGDTATKTISGTSMATPHTAGVAALYLQSHVTALPAAVRDALFMLSTKGKVSSSKSVNNHLLFSDL